MSFVLRIGHHSLQWIQHLKNISPGNPCRSMSLFDRTEWVSNRATQVPCHDDQSEAMEIVRPENQDT